MDTGSPTGFNGITEKGCYGARPVSLDGALQVTQVTAGISFPFPDYRSPPGPHVEMVMNWAGSRLQEHE